MRARYPDSTGSVERDGVKVAFEAFGTGDPAVVFVPIDAIVHSRAWKAQVPYLARDHLVVTIDPRGNGASDRPTSPEAYADTEFVADTIAVMDTMGIEKAVVIGLCTAGWRALLTAAMHPERVLGVVSIATWAPRLTPPLPERRGHDFDTPRDSYEGWAKFNRHYWATNWREYTEFFFSTLLSEPHSTKQIEDCVWWANETDPETITLQVQGPKSATTHEEVTSILRRIRSVLTIHGQRDQCQPHAGSELVAEITGGQLLSLAGVGHMPQAREPVVINHAIREFLRSFEPTAPVRRWTRPLDRRQRVLFLSSPIGLGHARRDLAIAEALRRRVPDVRIEWLAQPPVTLLLEQHGERIHPASRHLASEAAHIDAECAEHDLHAFQAVRRMDEILVNNFMVFADLVQEREYDAWVGDEAWELDYFLHENPRLKTAPYAWLTDFVGWLPMPDGGQRERELTTDYNAEMVEQVARFPRLRDKALFVGSPDDIGPWPLGDGLPGVREWTERHFEFIGYVPGFDYAEVTDRAAIRDALGFLPDERVCLVTAGGSAAGRHLLQRAITAFPLMAEGIPGLRMIVTAGPRIDPATLEPTSGGLPDGVEVYGYVPGLYRLLAACDLAIVQGGLTTTMELTALGRPFVFVPLQHHFEQNINVPYRLSRYRAGRMLQYRQTQPESLVQAVWEEFRRPVAYRPMENDGAELASARIAELL